MKRFSLVVLSLFALTAKAETAAVKALATEVPAKAETKTPKVLALRGKVSLVTGRDEAMTPAKVGIRLVEQAEIQTGTDGWVKIQLDPRRELTLFSGTKLKMPAIRWEGGEVPRLILEQGTLRLTAATADKAVRLQSVLFDLSPGEGDFVFRFSPAIPEAELQVVKGEQFFGALNAEDSVLVKSGENVVFRGALEDGEIAADILLQGKRIPRGKLGPVEKMGTVQMAPYLEEEARAQVAAKKAKEVARQRADNDLKAGVICASPRGQLNDCAWTCRGNPKKSKTCQFGRAGVTCVRERCNANGKWAEPFTLTDEDARLRCQGSPVVAACDY